LNRAISICGSPQVSTDAPPARRRPRLAWLDFFRGAAVLVMIETHVINTFLAAGLREGGWFPLLNYANGLVAPSFLFIAGFVQGIERRTSPGKPINFQRCASRLLGIVALGYALHFPVAELATHRWADALRVGTQVDVLQCLAIGLGFLLGLTWWVQRFAGRQSEAIWWGGVAVLAIASVLGAPLAQGWMGAPMALRAWFNGTTGSLFPLFPWIGFVFLGALMGAWPERPVAERAAGIVGIAVLAWACRGPTFSAFSPAFFLERAAWVLALAAICEWSARRPLPAMFLYAGKHSLKLYVAHLALITTLVVAGVPVLVSGVPVVLALLAGVGAVSLGVAWFFERLPLFPAPSRPREELPSAAGESLSRLASSP